MVLADINLTCEPAYPWSIPTIGTAGMLGVALALTALTVWTYLGVSQATFRRVLIVLLLRLAALAVAFGILLRPSFAITQLEGVEATKLLVVVDASASMNVADTEGKPTRWEQVNSVWKSKAVQRRLQELKTEQKIDVLKYLGAADLRAEESDALPTGTRTDIGAWLHQLWQKHGQDKNLRGIVLFSDGADNGTRFAVQEQARRWRGIAPIHTFGAGDPASSKFKKDLGLTRLDVEPATIFIKSKLTVKVIAQAPGFDKTEFGGGTVWLENLQDRKPSKIADVPKFTVTQEKDFRLPPLTVDAPKEAGEYKLTVEITPHAEETNKENNKISTYVHVIKEKINVLWIDRPRVYEPKRIIDFALKPEERLKVHYIEVQPGDRRDRFALYRLDQHYDVIVIGDISAQQFALGNAKVFEAVKNMVENEKTGLLMLGGSETFALGGWQEHPSFMNLLPVDFNVKGKAVEFAAAPVEIAPPKEIKPYPFLQIDRKLWEAEFEPLTGLAAVGEKRPGSSELLTSKAGKPVLVATRINGISPVAVFAADSTAECWFGSREAAAGFTHFWKHLVFWLARHEERGNEIWVKLDKRRMTTDPADVLGFSAGVTGKEGATLNAKIVHGQQEFPVSLARAGKEWRGTFQGAKEPGEYQVLVESVGVAGKANAFFLVASDDIETLRPVAEHETLSRIASSAEGRFHLAEEGAFVRYLDELQGQVNRESHHRTTHWPDWTRVPSESTRDQLAGLWNSFALVGLLLFTALLGGEWLLRRWWGLV